MPRIVVNNGISRRRRSLKRRPITSGRKVRTGRRPLVLFSQDGSPYKTVRVNNLNKLHTAVLAANVKKLGVYKVEQGGIFKPALLCCRQYKNLLFHKAYLLSCH